jgi:hypothetical protein
MSSSTPWNQRDAGKRPAKGSQSRREGCSRGSEGRDCGIGNQAVASVDGRTMIYPQARVLGGGSSINAQVHRPPPMRAGDPMRSHARTRSCDHSPMQHRSAGKLGVLSRHLLEESKWPR